MKKMIIFLAVVAIATVLGLAARSGEQERTQNNTPAPAPAATK